MGVNKERHSIVPVGGRIKMARQPLDTLYRLSQPILERGSVESCYQTMNNFRAARKRPRGAHKRDFFPLTTADIKGLMDGPGFYRGTLKTDQGPAGMFAGFEIVDNQTDLCVRVLDTKGLAVPEIYFRREIERTGIDDDVLSETQEFFLEGDEIEARLALERLEMLCAQKGILPNREATVGRVPFFFIRPAVLEGGIAKVSKDKLHEISLTVQGLIHQVEAKADAARKMVRSGVSIDQALSTVTTTTINETGLEKSSIIYAQPDVVLRRDGSFIIDKLNIPDVVFFLTQVDSLGIPEFESVKSISSELETEVMRKLVDEFQISGKSRMVLVTRTEVLENQEDTLEILEIQAISDNLRGQNIQVDETDISKISSLKKDDFLILLNINTQTPEFKQLMQKSVAGELLCYPDPFVLYFKDMAHTYPEIKLTSEQISTLRAIVEPIDDKPIGVLRQHLALKGFLRELSFDKGDIFYLLQSDTEKTVPMFKYDLRSFSLAIKYLGEESALKLRMLDFKPEDAVVTSERGSHLAAFRFMFVRN